MAAICLGLKAVFDVIKIDLKRCVHVAQVPEVVKESTRGAELGSPRAAE